MLPFLFAGFGIGFAGSFHCIGMCGPLAIAMPWYSGEGYALKVLRYHLGRTLTYVVLGQCFGIIGNAFYIAGYQQLLSIALGVLILYISLNKILSGKIPIFKLSFPEKLNIASSTLFRNHNLMNKPFLFGMINGLLPCGLIYLAVATAMTTGNLWSSVMVMAAFGFGTMPLFSVFLLGINKVSFSIRNKINKTMPYLVLLTSILLILRGLNLGIQYVSPKLNVEGTTPGIINCK